MITLSEAGSVWVSVIPSLKGFTTKVKSELRNFDIDLGVNVDTKAAKAKISEATKGATAEVDVDTRRATSQLSTWSKTVGRLNSVNVNVGLDKKSLGDSIVGVAALGRAMGTLAVPAAALAATPYLLSLGASAVQATGSLALLPAAAGAGALAVGTLNTAFTGFGDAIGDDPKKAAEAMAKMAPAAVAAAVAVNGLKPAWQGLRLDVQERMFSGLSGQITGLGNTYIPILRGAMSGLASDINVSVVDAFDTLRERGNVTGIATGLGFVRVGLGAMSGALAPLTQAFTTLFIHGAPYVATFGFWVRDAAGAFSLFIANASRAGLIEVWINNALLVIRQLGQVGMNVGLILGSMFGAAQRSGEPFLGVLVRITGAAAAALRTPEGAEGLTAFFTGIRIIVGHFVERLIILWPLIQSLGIAFFRLLDAAAPLLDVVFRLVVAALIPLADILGWMAPVLGPIIAAFWLLNLASSAGAIVLGLQTAALWLLNGAITAVRIASAIWTGVQWLLNAALSANPIGLVVLALAGLVAGVIYAYNNFTWFKTAVDAVGAAFVWLWQSAIVPAWNAITGAISWAWNSIIWPVLQAIGTALAFLGTAIGVVLVAPFVIAWNLISALVGFVWNSVLYPIWIGAIVPALQFMGSIFTWLWQAVIVPVWNGISLAIQIAWTVISAIFNFAIGFIRGVFAATWNFLWTGVIVPVWNGITSAISAAWNVIRGSIFDPIVSFLRGVLGPVFEWLWRNVIVPVWNGIQNAIQNAWNFIQGVFNTGKAAVQAVGQAFQNVADWVGRAWAAIREHARGPVQFVVDVVYNNGIRPVWNGIASLFGMGQLGPVNFAEGGVLPGYTPGRDIFNARLSGGEGILVPEAVRGLGPAFVGWANRTFSGGRSPGGVGTGYAEGGIVGGRRGSRPAFAEGGIFAGIGDLAGGAGEFFMNIFTDASGAVKKLFSSVLGDGARTPGTGSWTDALKALPGKAIEGIIKKVKEWVDSLASMAMGGVGGGAARWAGVASQALAMAGAPQSWLPLMLAQIQSESGGNPNAINLWDINAQRGYPSRGLLQTIPQTFNAYAGPLRGLGITHPLANLYAAVKYVQARYGSPFGVWGRNRGYDEGGVASGVGYMPKYTLRPERVLSPRQTASFERLVPLLDSMSRRGAGIGAGVYDGMGGAGGSGPAIGVVHQHLPDGASARRFAEELTFEVRRNGLTSGVHGR